jgi:hypothetical protein
MMAIPDDIMWHGFARESDCQNNKWYYQKWMDWVNYKTYCSWMLWGY